MLDPQMPEGVAVDDAGRAPPFAAYRERRRKAVGIGGGQRPLCRTGLKGSIRGERRRRNQQHSRGQHHLGLYETPPLIDRSRRFPLVSDPCWNVDHAGHTLDAFALALGLGDQDFGEPPAADGSIRFAHGARRRSPPGSVTILSREDLSQDQADAPFRRPYGAIVDQVRTHRGRDARGPRRATLIEVECRTAIRSSTLVRTATETPRRRSRREAGPSQTPLSATMASVESARHRRMRPVA